MRFIIILNIGNVREDGLFHQNVWRILNKDKKLNTESLYNNSYWFKFSDFKKNILINLKNITNNKSKNKFHFFY